MPSDAPIPETAHQQGRRIACEGILRSHFGRRPSSAVSQAIERLKENAGGRRIISFAEPTETRRTPHTLLRPALALAAGIAVLLRLGFWYFGPTMGKPVLARVTGPAVSIERGTEFIPASVGLRLEPTDVLRTGTNGAATVAFGKERTTIELSADTELKLASLAQGKRFQMRTGQLKAAVSRQRPFQPMVVGTPQAEARVLGTEFTLAVTPDLTRLDVSDGKVSFWRTGDTKPVEVKKNHHAFAGKSVEPNSLPTTGGILREIWTDIPGGEVNDLLDHPHYPNRPARRDLLKSFETPVIETNNYACRLIGYIHPPVTGEYTFWIASGGYSALWLSPDENSVGQVRIATAPGGLPRQWWDGSSQQHKLMMPQSPKIRLVAGRRYFIQAVEKAATNSSHLEVAWKVPGAEREVISGEFLSPFKPKN